MQLLAALHGTLGIRGSGGKTRRERGEGRYAITLCAYQTKD